MPFSLSSNRNDVVFALFVYWENAKGKLSGEGRPFDFETLKWKEGNRIQKSESTKLTPQVKMEMWETESTVSRRG